MSAALAEASSAAVASSANVERQTLGLREPFQPGHKGCLTTRPRFDKTDQNAELTAATSRFADDELEWVSTMGSNVQRNRWHRDSEVNPFLQHPIECFETTGVGSDAVAAVGLRTELARWS